MRRTHALTRLRLWAPVLLLGLGAAVNGSPSSAGGGQAMRSETEVRLTRGPHLFLDDTLIEASEQLTRQVNRPPRDLPGPIVTGTEDHNFQPYVTVVQDPETRRYRMWYNADQGHQDVGLGSMESDDAVHWKRPHRDLSPPPGSHLRYGASVIDEGPGFSIKDQRFKYGWWLDDGLRIATSPDGFAWKLLTPGVVIPHNHDIDSIHWDPIRKRYLAFVSNYTTGPNWSGKRRCAMESTSTDLIHWEKPWFVVTPDDSKDEGETQFYCMSAILARGDLLIGLVKVLRDELPLDPGGKRAGIGYTTLAWSYDGRTWTRDREPFLERNPVPATWDHAMSWIDCQLPVGDQVYLYYAGYARGHKIERFTERQIGLVRLPRDRYVARVAGPEAGTMRTPLMRIDGDRLTLNVDARGGEVRARLLTSDGRPVRGFGFEECLPITGDSLDAGVTWKGKKKLPKNQPVRLELQLRSAKLYALGVN